MKNFKFLIVLPYYNRPKMLRNCLKTFLESSYDNWHIAVIDDVSDEDKKAKPILEEVFPTGTLESVRYTLYDVDDTRENKERRGSIHSTYMNKAMREIDADYVITIGDDDGIFDNYLYDLNEFYNQNPEVVYSFAHIIPYDSTSELPCYETFEKRKKEIRETGKWRDFNSDSWIHVNHTQGMPPVDVLDGTQVSWNRKKVLDAGVEYNEEVMFNCDREIFTKLFREFGVCHYNKCVGPYKGFHGDQMGVRERQGRSKFDIEGDFNE